MQELSNQIFSSALSSVILPACLVIFVPLSLNLIGRLLISMRVFGLAGTKFLIGGFTFFISLLLMDLRFRSVIRVLVD